VQSLDPMRFAVVGSNNLVVNVIEAPRDWTVDGYTLVASSTAGPNDTWDGRTFTPRPEVLPEPTLRERYVGAATTAQRLALLAEAVGLEEA